MPEVTFNKGQVVRGKASLRTEEKARSKPRGKFVANSTTTISEKKPKVELRDYFLAAVAQGLCANPEVIRVEDRNTTNKFLAEKVRILAVAITDEIMLHGR